MATKKAEQSYSIWKILEQDAPTTVNVKLVTGDLIINATVLEFAANGIKILDTQANLVRYLNEWNTSYISTAVPPASA